MSTNSDLLESTIPMKRIDLSPAAAAPPEARVNDGQAAALSSAGPGRLPTAVPALADTHALDSGWVEAPLCPPKPEPMGNPTQDRLVLLAHGRLEKRLARVAGDHRQAALAIDQYQRVVAGILELGPMAATPPQV